MFLGLYSGAIMLSGSTLDSWTLTRKPLNFAKSVASSLKISSKNIAQMVSELKNLSPEKIQEATSSAYTKVSHFHPFHAIISMINFRPCLLDR